MKTYSHCTSKLWNPVSDWVCMSTARKQRLWSFLSLRLSQFAIYNMGMRQQNKPVLLTIPSDTSPIWCLLHKSDQAQNRNLQRWILEVSASWLVYKGICLVNSSFWKWSLGQSQRRHNTVMRPAKMWILLQKTSDFKHRTCLQWWRNMTDRWLPECI